MRTRTRALRFSAQRLRGFNLDEYVNSGTMEFSDGTLIQFVTIVLSSLARHLAAMPLSRGMTLQPEGGKFKVAATVKQTWQPHWWVLSQADDIKVLRQTALRKEIGARLSIAGNAYAETIKRR